MSVVITLNDIQAYAEVDYIINHMNEKYIEKVPEKMRAFFRNYKDPNHEVKINPYVPLEKQGLKKYALEIIALLHLRYWCEDEQRKQELYNIMIENQDKLEVQMNEKYSMDNLFNNSNEPEEKVEEETEDFSKPRVIQKYEQYTKNNNDIQDYTDYEDAELPVQSSSEENKSFFKKLKEKIMSFFLRNKL